MDGPAEWQAHALAHPLADGDVDQSFFHALPTLLASVGLTFNR